jgi:hypothetical protein
MNILDHISESLETIFWVKILKFFDAECGCGSGSRDLEILLTLGPGTGMEKIRIRDKHPGSGDPGSATLRTNFLHTLQYPHTIPVPSAADPGSELFPSRIHIKEFKYFNPKKWFLSYRKYDSGCSSRIRILTF